MMVNLETLGRWLIAATTRNLDWIDRKIERRHQQALKDRRTLEGCVIGCLVLFLLAWWSGGIATMGRSICLLALIIVTLKLFQLLMIVKQGERRNCDE